MSEINLIHPEKTLVKYELPTTVSQHKIDDLHLRAIELVSYNNSVETNDLNLKIAAYMKETEYKLTISQTRNLLNFILPPKLFEIDNRIYYQEISPVPFNRAEVQFLTEIIESYADIRKIKARFICPIRRQLYNDLFIELIRQISIQCFERGLLLKYIYNEIMLTLACYQTICFNFTEFGIRQFNKNPPKQLKQERINELQIEIKELRDILLSHTKHINALEKKYEAEMKLLVALHAKKLKHYNLLYKQSNTQLNDIKALMQSKSYLK